MAPSIAGWSHVQWLSRFKDIGAGDVTLEMEAGIPFAQPLLLLAGAVLAAPLFKRFGLGTILGYLAAGFVIGPVAQLVADGDQILNVAQLGIVFLLFIIGLELSPSRLWALRREMFGLGLAQVAACAIAFTALAVLLLGQSIAVALILGLGLAQSSTAFAMQLLEEEGAVNRRYGRTTLSIVLFQDIMVGPTLALIPLLAPITVSEPESGLWQVVAVLAAVLVLALAGRYVLNPLFRIIANTGAKEAMIAAALLVVLGSAVLMELVGLSMAMGAFIAGVMLAESSYRHELQADIEPFRGILLGLFFMAIGMSVDLSVIAANWLTILLAVPILMAMKTAIIYGLCRFFSIEHNNAIRSATLLAQGGETGLVVFSVAASDLLFDHATSSVLFAIVAVSMALTPFAARLGRKLTRPAKTDLIEEDFEGAGADVLMIGFSRFGQIASQVLLSGGTDVTIIDHSAERVRSVEKFGFRIYFGDGRRKDVLEAAGIRRAKLVAICTNARATTDHIVDLIQSEFPHVKLYVRSYDRAHTLSLRDRGVEYEIRETLESALMFGRRTIEALGVGEDVATQIADDVRKRDEERLEMQITEGFYAGDGRKPVAPEPLVKPSRQAKRLDKEDEVRLAAKS